MYQQETIFNLIPKEIIKPPKEQLYRSRFPPDLNPTGSTFGILCSSYPGVANLNGSIELPRGAHPVTAQHGTLGKPNGMNKILPENFIKKGHLYKTSPPPERIRQGSCEFHTKPCVPKMYDKPIMGLKSDKNFVTANAVDVILMGKYK